LNPPAADFGVKYQGRTGGYKTKMSKKTGGRPCPECGSIIAKENYLGGNIYFCAQCQKR
jgi:formamidopyrimidine-DNA glycosylase